MKFTSTLILTLLLTFSSFSRAQKDDVECKKYRSLAGEEIKMKNYKRAAKMYLKALEFCDACDKAAGNDIVYDNLKYSYETMWKAEKDEARQKELADTVVWIYELRIKQCTDVSSKWNASYGYFLGKSKINHVKCATILGEYIDEVKEKAGVSYMYQYFSSVYMSYATTKENKWRDTLVKEYFILNEHLDALKDDPTQGPYVDQIKKAIEGIMFDRVLKSCDEITNVIELKVGQFADMSREDKLDFCSKALDILDKKECIESPIYGRVIEIYIELLPDSLVSEGAYKYGKYLEGKREYKKAGEYYEIAILKNNNPDNNDKYKAGKVRIMFRQGQYKACFSLAKSVGGEYRGECLKIAAQCIAQTANSCGESTIDRKANYYLAIDYLEKAGAAGANVSGLKATYKRSCPTKEEKFKVSWQNGKQITLSCWGETTTVRD